MSCVIVALMLFFSPLFCPPLSLVTTAHAQMVQPSQKKLPSSITRLKWEPSLQRFTGLSAYQVAGDSLFTLALYANNSLNFKRDSRAEQEFFVVGFPGEDIWSMDRTGTLNIKEVKWGSDASKDCTDLSTHPLFDGQKSLKMSSALLGPAFLLKKAEYSLNASETLLTVKPDQSLSQSPSKEGAADCAVLFVSYDFVPPRTEGNFGFESESKQSYSGPLAPLPLGKIFNNKIFIDGLPGICLDCETLENGVLFQDFDALPSPLHLGESNRNVSEMFSISGFKIGIVGQLDSSIKREIISLIEELLMKFKSEFGDQKLLISRSGFHFLISADQLKERLVFAQKGELHLGNGLLKISPFFSKYHKAAFARELLILLFGTLLEQRHAPEDWQQLRLNSSITQYYARTQLMNWYSGLDSIKSFASKLSFIPLFDDILAGTALQNNEVFLGERESATRVDTLSDRVLVPTLSGTEIEERLSYCYSDSQRNEIDSAIKNFVSGETESSQLLNFLESTRSEQCPYSLSALFSHFPVHEIFNVERLETVSNRSTVYFTRVDSFHQESRPFFERFANETSSQHEFRDTPRLSIISQHDGKVLLDKIWHYDSKEKTVAVELSELESGSEARIDGPTLGSFQERHIFPREYKFLISGLKFGFNSEDGYVRIETGVQLRLLGDEYGRSFNFGLNIDSNEVEVVGSFALDLGTLFDIKSNRWELGETIDSDNSIFNAFPLTVGAENLSALGSSGKNATSTFLSIGARNVYGSKLVPSGYQVSYRLKRQLLENQKYFSSLTQELSAGYDQAMGRLTTLSFSPLFGKSDTFQDLSSYVPGRSNVQYLSKEYVAIHSQLKTIVLTGFNIDLLGSLLFQDMGLFGAHHIAFDTDLFRGSSKLSESLQSLEGGVQIFGAFFGAKNQSLALSVTRTLSTKPTNSFSMTIGRN